MSIFGAGTAPDTQEILDEIRSLKKDLARIQGERDAYREDLDLATDVVRLKRELTNLEIEKDRVTEQHKRERRDVEHMVGLEKKRQAFEIDSAKRDTSLTIREENLAADRDRFEQQMDFMSKRFDTEVSYLKELMTDVLKRLPNVEVNKTVEISHHQGAGRKAASG